MRDLNVILKYRTYVAILICDEDIEDRFLLVLTFTAEVCHTYPAMATNPGINISIGTYFRYAIKLKTQVNCLFRSRGHILRCPSTSTRSR